MMTEAEIHRGVQEQKGCPYLRGPWTVHEKWASSYEPSLIWVEAEVSNYEETAFARMKICKWAMGAAVRGSPAYFIARAHAELIQQIPELRKTLEELRRLVIAHHARTLMNQEHCECPICTSPVCADILHRAERLITP